MPARSEISAFFETLQNEICAALEAVDGTARFRPDRWMHSAGGGLSRVLQDGPVFEKAAVNTSAIESDLTEKLAAQLGVTRQLMFATGISVIVHPRNPYVPTVHANFRYLALASGEGWFGGGADLTPYYVFQRDAVHFHRTWKNVCDRHDASFYPRFKKWCDDYFFLPHRGEARGIGGIFFDHLQGGTAWAFVQDCGASFLESYLPIVQNRRNNAWGDEERTWQSIRRGRYAEFNLLHDRGTAFGLETAGRTESILASLPPLARWDYDFKTTPGSREEELIRVLQRPKDWIDC